MKKIVSFLTLILGIFLFASSNLLAQGSDEDFEYCFVFERLKAKNEGANTIESINQAKEVCNLKLGNSQGDNNATGSSTEENLENSGSRKAPIFTIDIFTGKKKVKGEKSEKLVTTGVLLNYYITPKFSLAAGYLLSKGDVNGTVVDYETESYTDYSDYSYVDETYDATVARYTDETRDIRIKQYKDETRDIQVKQYKDETYDDRIARYTITTSGNELRPNELTKPGDKYFCSFGDFSGSPDICYAWNYARRVYGTFFCGSSFADRLASNYYQCIKIVRKPDVFKSSCKIHGGNGCIQWQYQTTYGVFSYYETKTLTERVFSHFETKTFTERVFSHYETETLISQVFSHYETETLTRQVASYVTKTRQVPRRSRTENLSIKNIESSLGAKWHLLGNGLVDFFLGAGIVNISHSREYLNTVESGSGSGTYFETGIKYIFNSGFNIGYYWRRSSATFELTNNANQQTTETDGGGITSGLTFGFAF